MMKFGVIFLEFSVGILVIALGLFIYICFIGEDGPDLAEPGTIIVGLIPLVGIILAYILIRNAYRMGAIWFTIACVLYFLQFTLPVLVIGLFAVAMGTAG